MPDPTDYLIATMTGPTSTLTIWHRLDGFEVAQALEGGRQARTIEAGLSWHAAVRRAAEIVGRELLVDVERQDRLDARAAQVAGVQLSDDEEERADQLERWRLQEVVAGKLQGELLAHGLQTARAVSGNLEQPPQLEVRLEREGVKVRWIFDGGPTHVSALDPLEGFAGDPSALRVPIVLDPNELSYPSRTARALRRKILEAIALFRRSAQEAAR